MGVALNFVTFDVTISLLINQQSLFQDLSIYLSLPTPPQHEQSSLPLLSGLALNIYVCAFTTAFENFALFRVNVATCALNWVSHFF